MKFNKGDANMMKCELYILYKLLDNLHNKANEISGLISISTVSTRKLIRRFEGARPWKNVSGDYYTRIFTFHNNKLKEIPLSKCDKDGHYISLGDKVTISSGDLAIVEAINDKYGSIIYVFLNKDAISNLCKDDE